MEAPWRQWTLRDSPLAPSSFRLFCFPYAGGGASAFLRWQGLFPHGIDLVPVQPPGRENRADEPVPASCEALLESMGSALAPLLSPSMAFWGHSMGGHVACAFARWLEDRGGPVPRHLFLTATPPPPPPGAPARTVGDLLALSDGIPDAVRACPPIMEAFLRTARADCVLLADLVRHAAPVRMPASVLAGSQDPLAPATGMERWKDLLAAGFSLDVFEGGHFFPRAHRDEVAGLVSDTLLLYLFQG